MKKITYLCLLIGTFGWVNAQVLNQSAGWPNAAWSITGSYATAAAAFESDPTTTPNFAFDDDDAGQNHEDNIAAESPVINLTAAHTAGETWLSVTAQYGYRYVSPDQLRLEYYNADTQAWVAWGANIPGNNTSTTDLFCTITKTTYNSSVLNIASFTATQLAGFKYRIAYDDNPASFGWNWGFCFDSPTITSATPPSCPVPTVGLATPAVTSAVLSWTENGTATLYNIEYGANGFTQGSGTVISGVANSYNLTPLTANTQYSYYVQAACGGTAGNSTWAGPFNFTTLFEAPANDECDNAVALTVNADLACGTVTAGTIAGATPSNTDVSACDGNEDDDVWFSFVATSVSHSISLTNVVGSATDMFHSLWTGDCSALTLVPGSCSDPNTSLRGGLTIGDTYYVRVNTYTATGNQNTTFNICIGTPPPPPANDECDGAEILTVNEDFLCAVTTSGTILGATGSSTNTTACFGTEDDDVWYAFVATSTSHRVSLTNVAGSDTDMYHSVWTGECSALTLVPNSCSDANTSNPSGLIIGETYYVRVYTWGATAGQTTTFSICIGSPAPPPPAPDNDECEGAIDLTVNADQACGTVTAGTTNGATESMAAAPCFGAPDDDVWYTFTATSTSHRVSLTNIVAEGGTGTSTDAYIQVLSGACGTLTSFSCSDPETSNLTGLTIGETYYVRVYTYYATNGITFNICVGTPPPPPANDNLANAIAVSCANTYTGDTTLATLDENNAPDGFGADMDAPNVWYSFTGTGAAQTVTLNLCGSSYDTSVLVYTGTSGALTLVAANDDDSSCNATNDSTRSRVSFSSDGTTTYLIAVEGWNAASIGAFTMDVTCAAVNPPAVANQTCATALNVLVDNNDNNSDNSFGTINPVQPTCDTFGSIQDVWFSFTAPASGEVIALLTRGTMTSLNYTVYSGDCAVLTQVGTCTTNQTAASATQTYTGLTAGNTYYMQVWSSGAEQGTFTLRLSESLGTNPFDPSVFAYYPNPVKDVLNLSYDKEITNVEVFNLLGQRVMANKANTNNPQVDMSNLPNGTYMVKVTADNQVKTIKVIKQ